MYNGQTPSSSTRGAERCSGSSIPATRWSDAACCSTSPASAASTGLPTAKPSRTTSSTPAPRSRRSRSGSGDFVIVRTGQMERCLEEKKWGGYAGGDAPGVKFENCYWCQDKEIAAICTDTWGVEVRPNETTEANQPWHWVVIPAMGLSMGEIFYLKELAEDRAADKVYEFFFAAPPLSSPAARARRSIRRRSSSGTRSLAAVTVRAKKPRGTTKARRPPLQITVMTRHVDTTCRITIYHRRERAFSLH